MSAGQRRKMYRRARITRLYEEQEGRCYWCLCHTFTPDDPRYYRSTGALSGKAATVDHVYSRIHPLRHAKASKKLVMACSTCNGKRAAVEHAELKKNGTLEPRIYRPEELGSKRRAQGCQTASTA